MSNEQVKLVITPASGWRGNSTLRLRALCKAMLRSYGFRIVSMEGDITDQPEASQAERDRKAIKAVLGEPAPAKQ